MPALRSLRGSPPFGTLIEWVPQFTGLGDTSAHRGQAENGKNGSHQHDPEQKISSIIGHSARGNRMLDHIYISVSDVPRSLAFYAATLEPLGWRELGSYDSSTGPAGVPDLHGLADATYGSGVAVGSSIWLRQRQPSETGLYVAFVADDEAEVNAAYAAAMEAGGTSEGDPAMRSYFGPGYYAANVVDFDDNHLEIVHKSFNPRSR